MLRLVEMSNELMTYEKSYVIESFLVNKRRKLGLYYLLNVLQDTSIEHSSRVGHGHRETMERKAFWVLTRQHLAMSSWPDWGTKIDVRTWIRPLSGAIATRDFVVIQNGKEIGQCTTGWVLLDADSRRPIKDGSSVATFPFKKEGVLSLETTKILPLEKTEKLASFQVRNSDIDMNEHVNNTKYSQWILDAMPIEWHSQYKLEHYQINFLAESKLGDTVEIGYAIVGKNEGRDVVQYQGLRESDRKPVFTALLETSSHS